MYLLLFILASKYLPFNIVDKLSVFPLNVKVCGSHLYDMVFPTHFRDFERRAHVGGVLVWDEDLKHREVALYTNHDDIAMLVEMASLRCSW